MPILYAEIQVAGHRERLDTYGFTLHQPTDSTGQPSSITRAKPIELTLTGLAATLAFFAEWAGDSHLRRSGQLVFYDGAGQVKWRLTFFDAWCVLHQTAFHAQRSSEAAYQLTLELSPAAVDVNGVHVELHSDLWWEKKPATRFKALTPPPELLPSPSLRASLTPSPPAEGPPAGADFMRFEKAKKPLSERPQSKKTGYLDSPKLTKPQLASLTKTSQERYGVTVQIVNADEMALIAGKPEVRAMFRTKLDATGQRRGTIYVQKKATSYEMTHELMHAKQFHQLGFDAYWVEQTQLQREEFVFNELMKTENQWSAAEVKHAANYIKYIKHGEWPNG